MYKVVYFDEGSATDFIQIHYGGNIEIVDEDSGKFSYQLKGSTDAKVGVGNSFLSLIKANFSLSGSGSIEKGKDSILKSTITNTLLSDFVDFAKSEENENKIKVFEGYKVDSISNSFAFIKMYAPYIKLLKEDTEYTQDLADFNFIDIGEILDGAKGYYELLAVRGDERAIFRFNINAFRNSYTLTDLTKMRLTYYGIKVGECNIEDLFVENEFPKEEETNTFTAGDIFNEQIADEKSKDLEIFDILLTGVTGDTNEV
ncbi:DUF6414 family protein [Halobacillus amylolyticus]|uniref:DUF6414 family protein n=1 Tax=Halobacillus amylolyticus TaxID=2932259 RepID=A0ABY4HEC1_9BACI|nr:DUF6414 family protein [Halobacillus amylolyticus]UOR12633.1 DUF6414 family protein [Halobacillus amylolyticus]